MTAVTWQYDQTTRVRMCRTLALACVPGTKTLNMPGRGIALLRVYF